MTTDEWFRFNDIEDYKGNSSDGDNLEEMLNSTINIAEIIDEFGLFSHPGSI